MALPLWNLRKGVQAGVFLEGWYLYLYATIKSLVKTITEYQVIFSSMQHGSFELFMWAICTKIMLVIGTWQANNMRIQANDYVIQLST